MLQANPFSANKPRFQPTRQRPDSTLPIVQGQASPGLYLSGLSKDTVIFAGKSERRKKIEQEIRRLRLDESGAIPGHKPSEAEYYRRAEFNLHGNKAMLDFFLPYRNKYVHDGNKQALAKYDTMVETIINQAQFYQASDYNQSMNKLQKLVSNYYAKQSIPENSSWFTKLKTKIRLKWLDFRMWISPKYRNKIFMYFAKKMKEKGIQVPQSDIDRVFQENARELDDNSSRYLMAASIAELYQNKPEWVESKLNDKNRPLKIVFTPSNNKQLIQGQYKFGLNTIWMHGPSTWFDAESRRLPGHHEFTHCLSEGENGEFLEGMSDSQKQEYKQIREQMKKKDATIFATIMRKLTRDVPSCGLPEYAFFNDMEFLPVSLDTFRQEPEKLCKTEPGKKLYALYKDLLGIDPLNDLSQAERSHPFKEWLPEY